jgi:hypothetical protein
MKKLLAILALVLAGCAGASSSGPVSPVALAAEAASGAMPVAEAALRAKANLRYFDVLLPEGDVGSISIDWITNNGATKYYPRDWAGYDGIRFIGRGPEKTRIRCTSWDGITIAIKRYDGAVAFKDVTIEAGYSKAIHAGEQNLAKVIRPNFAVVLENVVGVVPPPAEGRARTKWFFFAYNCDDVWLNVRVNAKQAAEHAAYRHGFAQWGSLWEDCDVSSGAEGAKCRPDESETAYHGPNAWVIQRRCHFHDWYQTWSDRGGAAVVGQNTTASYYADRCVFRGGGPLGNLTAWNRSKTTFFTSQARSYDILTGQVDKPGGFGNGWIILTQCAFSGGPGPSWYSPIIRVGRDGGAVMHAARGVLIDRCGIWGDHMSLQFDGTIPVEVRGCNTEAIRRYCRDALGMDTRHEAVITTAQRAIPASEGWRRLGVSQ